MTTTPTSLDVLAAHLRADGRRLTVRVMAGANGTVINVGPADRLTPADLEALRATLTEAGWTETDSWIATEGASWLSDGIQSVSLRVRPTNP